VAVLHRVLVALVAAATCGITATAAHAHQGHDDLARVRQATARYHDLTVAQAAGYGLLVDANGIACIDMPGMGAMGVHYVNSTFVGDSRVDPVNPEAVVYEPVGGNRLRLVAVEYVVFQAGWDAQHHSPPKLFGQRFALTPQPNRYGLPAFYSLHAWVWKNNPAGTFAMWNARVSCPGGGDHVQHGHG
jgi:hypothetical protein